jgi:hypothetical protein
MELSLSLVRLSKYKFHDRCKSRENGGRVRNRLKMSKGRVIIIGKFRVIHVLKVLLRSFIHWN